jgi:phosphatidylserine/phosphatidylglycerophosphate/cardiolipin synthase-like enzyme
VRAQLWSGLASLGLVAACGGAEPGSDALDQTAMPYKEGSAEAVAILAVANDRTLGTTELKNVVGLSTKAAINIVKHRDGADPVSPADDDPFDNLAELWAVPYCKRTCLVRLFEHAVETGVFDPLGRSVSVVFSPQPLEASHLVGVAKLIDEATETVDIAMYSYSHADPVRGAIERAVARGLKIRFLADGELAASASKVAGLEALGIDVRRVTKIMHHKLAVIDGPRDDATLGRAESAKIVTGSGNWSSGAATLYDENTLFLRGYPELALRIQRDFDTLWAGSKDVVYSPLSWDKTRGAITDALIAQHEDDASHAWFTSPNFKPTAGGGWSVLGTTVVTDQLVAAILSAKKSIEIASGHYVSIPIAQAVADAVEANPALAVTMALDCQEATRSGEPDALKKAVEQAGGSIHYKCNTYRWHYKLAKQMHHKYLVIDGTRLYTGSLNFSDNAETSTFENMLLFQGSEHAPLVKAYRDNLEKIRAYGRDDDLAALAELESEIETGETVPLVWEPPISMDQATYLALRDLIRAHCPATKSWLGTPEGKTYDKWFDTNPQWFTKCHKNGYAWPEVPADKRVQ